MQSVFQPVTPAMIDRLTAIVGSEQISAAQADLDQHAHDQGFYPAHAAEVVVWPTSAEQISQVLEGKFELTINGESKVYEPGGVVIIPSNIPHGGAAITDCKLLDIFSPVREDYR